MLSSASAATTSRAAAIWWEEMGQLFAKLRAGGRVDLLDNHLGPDGLDITIVAPGKKK